MLNVIRQWVIRTMMKSKGQTGVVQTLPKRDLIELNTQITAQKLMQGGIDPNSLKNANQVENAIIAIESRPPVQQGIRSTKSAKVMDMEGKEIKDPKNIMGGKEINQQTLNEELMKKDNPYSDLVNTPRPKTIKEREAEVLAGMEKNNKEAVQRIKNRKMVEEAIDNASPGFAGDRKYDAQLVADDLAEKKFGKDFYDLDQKQQMDLYGEALDGLDNSRLKNSPASEDRAIEDFVDDAGGVNPDDPRGIDDFIPDDDPEPLAQGGRAGFSKGSGLKILFDFFNKKSPLQFGKDYLKNVKDKTLKANETGKFMDLPLAEVGIPATTGAFINNQIRKKLKNMNEEQKEENLKEFIQELKADPFYKKNPELKDKTIEAYTERMFGEKRADGGRIGYDKGGMTRRSFLKILGGLATIPIVGKFLKPIKTAKGIKSVPIIKTDNVPGKPEWFDALVNKVIIEGDDVTKRFATADRQAVHQKTLDDGSVVRVTEDVDDGAIRVEYENEANVFGDDVLMQYKKPLPDEGAPNPSAEFTTAESGPVGRQTGPDDFELDVDEVGGSSINDLDSDVSKLKEYATGKKPTMKEFVQNKKRRDKASAITNDIDGAASDAVIRRQGDYDPSPDDFASGGIARMLGE